MTPHLIAALVGVAVAAAPFSVRFEGNHEVSEAELAGAHDTVHVLTTLYDHGLVEARVTEERVREPDGSVTTVFHVFEGPVYRLGRSTVVGDDLHAAPALPPSGSVFSRSTIVRALEQLRQRYRDAGEAEPLVTPISSIDRERHTIDLRIEVERAPVTR